MPSEGFPPDARSYDEVKQACEQSMALIRRNRDRRVARYHLSLEVLADTPLLLSILEASDAQPR